MPEPLVADLTFRVRYAETDQMGVAYYGNYLVWFEMGRSEYCRQAGYPYTRIEEEGFVMARHMLGSMRMAFECDLCRSIDLRTVQAIDGRSGAVRGHERAVRQARELGRRFATFRS